MNRVFCKGKSVFAALLAAVLLLCGCGDSSRPADAGDASNNTPGNVPNNMPIEDAGLDVPYYRVTEKPLPDPKAIFESDSENQGKNMFFNKTDDEFENSVYADAKIILSPQGAPFCADGKVCILYSVIYDTGSAYNPEDLDSFTGSYYVCVLEAPYEEWRFYPFSALDLSNEGMIPIVRRIAGIGGEGVYLGWGSGIGVCGWDGSCRFLGEIATENVSFGNPRLYPAGDALYALFSIGPTCTGFGAYDGQLKTVLPPQNLENTLSGCFSWEDDYLWYGFDVDQNLAVWDKPDGKQLFTLGDMVDDYADFLLTRSASGEFVLADAKSVWMGDGSDSLSKVLSFAERGYALQELLAMAANEDGSLSCIVRFEDSLWLLTLEQVDVPEDKQEITLVSMCTRAMNDMIAAFNRQSDKYRVVMVNPFDADDADAYCLQIQMEMSAGRGPDLVESWIVELEGAIRNGYIEPLDDVIENPSDFWPASLEIGRRDGVLYGICGNVYFSYQAVSESLAGGLDAWTLEQMMDAVRKSPAKSLQQGLDGMGIALQYGLMTRDNPQFIDYDAGVSHLTEQPFIDFLEFAKEYGDNLHYADAGCEEASDYYQDGQIAVFSCLMLEPSDLLCASALFRGQEVLIGMPAEKGRGVYMVSPMEFCLNSNSPSKEGAKEFLRYLVSAEGQGRLYRFRQKGSLSGFSCRRDVTEAILNASQEEAEKYKNPANGKSAIGLWGMHVENIPLSEEQVGQFFALFEEARPKPSIPPVISAIIEEELAPYFAGECSAAEAAGRMDNRIQLYFGESR